MPSFGDLPSTFRIMVSTNAIVAMKSIASDPKKRPVLMQDSACLGGLVMVLSNQDKKIVKLSLETLSLLAESAENRAPLRDFIGLLDQLDSLINRCKDKEIQGVAEKLYTVLTTVEMTTPLRDTKNTSRHNSSANCSKSFLGKHSTRSKTIVMQIRGMLDKHDREVCMRLLLQVKGIISVTFDLTRKRCIARTRADVKTETLVQAVARSQTMSAQQVIKDQQGKEILLSFGAKPEEMDKENSDMPEYLSDDGNSPVVDAKAMARTDRGEKKSGGWLGAAASFLSNSFYW
ncbi:armadillo repeat-containing protein 1-like [Liolophura sinensis]|uniref:armadillo repeat-containing protein 1-like n=1 Tax=Liolophura sinensis TaxID=3198878 RepID=UPI00315965EC